MRLNGIILSAVVLVVGLLAGAGARAAYPEHPIRLIVAYDAGGATDATARLLAPYIAQHLGAGAEIKVVNVSGDGGENGLAALAGAAADGYTLGFLNAPSVVTMPIERATRYKLDQFDPLVNIIDDPAVITVHRDDGPRTLVELLAGARASPGSLTYGTTGVASDDHLSLLQLQHQARVEFRHVPLPGNTINLKALLSHRTVACGQNLSEVQRVLRTEPVRVLGIMSDIRSPDAPDVPTMKEQGFNIQVSSLRGIAAPKGMPADLRARLVEAITSAALDPGFQAMARENLQPLRVMGPEAYAATLAAMDREFRMVWKRSPWKRAPWER
ncbi:MAG TPA: tripartite tricarboxylate transporter substrate binding protein [Azospirillaceae bacterium]|nr:tripartite tricarboxylate transporter substrate binding protein [Azospirillaceae bacterium]